MIWTNETAGNLSVDYNFGAGAWAQERNLLRIKIANATGPQLVEIEWGEVAEYMTNLEGKMLLDVSYIIRGEHAIGNTNGLMTISCGDDVIDLAFVVNGLIDPDNMIIPYANVNQLVGQYCSVLPPAKWIAPLFGLSDSVEVYATQETPADALSMQFTSGQVINTIALKNGLNSAAVPADAESIAVVFYESSAPLSLRGRQWYKRAEHVCGRTYASVEWISRTGALKRHTWEVVKVTDNTNGATEFLTADNSYHITKGIEQGLTLRLDGLSRYDYWYYSDIVTSSDVRVAVQEIDADFGDETRVAVTTDSVEQPDTSDFFTLEITIKYRRYDEI